MALKAGLSLDKNIQQLYDKIYEEDFEKLCPIYRRALEDLAAKLNALKTAEEKLLILEKFSEIYLLLPKYARQKIELQKVVSRQHPMISTAAAATCVQPLYSVPFSETIKSINPWTIRQLIADLNCTDKHIAWKSFPVNFDKQLKNISNVERSIKDTERALTFPHRYLQKVFDYYKIMGTKPITKQLEANIKKLIKLYEKFEEAEMDDEKWFKCMNELDEDDVIIANIEYRLGFEMKCSNKNIWKYYIKFMREKKNAAKEMLEIFRRYCRLFISDKEMREEYRKCIEENENIATEFWYDTIKFELQFFDLKSANLLFQKWVNIVSGMPKTMAQNMSQNEFLENLENFKIKMEIAAAEKKNIKDTVEKERSIHRKRKAIEYKKIVPPKPGCSDEKMGRFVFKMKGKEYKSPKKCHSKQYYQPNNSFPQNFIFKIPFIHYITQSATPHLLQKLYFSCKFFYSIYQISLCHKLTIVNYTNPNASHYSRFFQHSFILSVHDITLLNSLKNLHITNNLTCGGKIFGSTNRTILSEIISRLYKCEAKYLDIFNQDLTIDNFAFLICSGKIEKVELEKTQIFNSNGILMNPSEIEKMIKKYNKNFVDFKFE